MSKYWQHLCTIASVCPLCVFRVVSRALLWQNVFLHEKCVLCLTTGYLFCQFNVIRKPKPPRHKLQSFSLYLFHISFSHFPHRSKCQHRARKIMSEMTLQTPARTRTFSHFKESCPPDEELLRKRTWKHSLICRV